MYIKSGRANAILLNLSGKSWVYYRTKNKQKPSSTNGTDNSFAMLTLVWGLQRELGHWPMWTMFKISLWQFNELSDVHLLYLLCLIKSKPMHFLISFSSLIRATINLMKDIVCFYFQFSFPVALLWNFNRAPLSHLSSLHRFGYKAMYILSLKRSNYKQ